MKLIDYVIQNDKEIEDTKYIAEHYKMTLEDYILEGMCPSAFDSLVNTPYEQPYSKYKADKTDCTYRYTENLKKCKECWNREVLVAK